MGWHGRRNNCYERQLQSGDLLRELRPVLSSGRIGGVQDLLFRAGEFVPPEKLNDAQLLGALIEMAGVPDRKKALDDFYRIMTDAASDAS
jgi:hypothetical protein